MEPIIKIDASVMQRRAAQCVRDRDPDGLGSVLAEVESQRQAFFQQAVSEDRERQEAERALAGEKGKIAFLTPAEARQRFQDLQFVVALHNERALACEQQSVALGKLLTDLRKQSEELQGRLLSARLAKHGHRLIQELAD
jgi:hypothetical protein